MIENLNSQQLLEYLGDIIAEIRSRSDICISKKGIIHLKECPDCGSYIQMCDFTFNGTEDDIAAITNSSALGEYPIKRWEKYLEREHKAGRIELPYIEYSILKPPAKPGCWYICVCDCHCGKWCSCYDDALNSYMNEMDFPVIRMPVSKEGAEGC